MTARRPAEPRTTVEAVPFVIVVTAADADRAELSDFESALGRFFGELKRDYPSTPVIIVSPLACEVERVAARAAAACGATIIGTAGRPAESGWIPEPSNDPPDEGEAAIAGGVTRLGATPGAESGTSDGIPLEDLASRAGLLILLHGGRCPADGMLRQAITLRVEGADSALSPIDRVGQGPVAVLGAGEDQSGLSAGRVQWTWYSPGSPSAGAAAPAESRELWRRRDEFNRDLLQLKDAAATERARSHASLLSADLVAAAGAPFVYLVDRFAATDALAIVLQQKSLFVFRGILVIALAGALCFEAAGLVTRWQRELSAGYFVALVAAIGWYLWFRMHRCESRYLDYRALAEGLRVQLFWRLAGRVDSAADLYLRRQQGELGWIREALSSWDVSDGEPGVPGNPLPDWSIARRLRTVVDRWIIDQRNYFQNRARRERRVARLYAALKRLCLVAGVVLAFIKVWLPAGHPLMAGMGLAMLVAGILQVYEKSRAFEEHARQYERMGKLFETAAREAERWLAEARLERAGEVIHEAGVEALQENADWLLLHRDRPVRVPGLAS